MAVASHPLWPTGSYGASRQIGRRYSGQEQYRHTCSEVMGVSGLHDGVSVVVADDGFVRDLDLAVGGTVVSLEPGAIEVGGTMTFQLAFRCT